MAEINQIIPPKIWPKIEDDAPWKTLPIAYHFDNCWNQLHLGRPTHSLRQIAKYSEDTLKGHQLGEKL